ncbi:hypothetical protein PC9H_003975 [Pleurotus ostreatus]|uniref:Protein kinase domain-containing protein n=1 Tax=Pleurotus ostreatus TaxID=5322 RepID=A0A8H7A1V0_PLEOS|nr:uncharacterized protein PC9H_003975 [Pleurotus ostreatus]KAF7437139.1 hypothetical protein PC9H_003975 [Pleurotus ostreatus]
MPPSTIRPTSSAGLQSISRAFIGAVEDEWQLYSDRSEDYTLGSTIGFGASSIVYTALFHPPADPSSPKPEPIPCALKVLDLDSLAPHPLSLLQRETTLMSLSKHPNVIRVRGTWTEGHKLYIAMRLMNKGSAADVMRYGWPGGMEEEVVKCILRQALQGLNYLHVNGFIHRDIKAANLLIDDDGTVLLGDLGVAADLSEDSSFSHLPSGAGSKRRNITTASAALAGDSRASSLINDQQHVAGKRVVLVDSHVPQRPKMGKRKSFVGTPCWMAPELIQGRQYDASADIWSFGITALELTQGRPPRAREPSQKVLLNIIQEDPPTLDRDGGTFKYSRAFKEVIDSCLIKDPSKRPTAEQLLQTPFFKSAKKPSYLVAAILKALPPLTQRQERQAIASAQTHRTVESWDFATTIHTPTTSVYRRRLQDDSDHSHHLGSDEDVSLIDMDQHRSHSSLSSRAHNKGVSWHDDTEVVEEDPEEDVDSAPGTSPSGESTSERVFTEEEAPSTSSSVDSLDAKHVPHATNEPDDAEKVMPSTAPMPIPIPVSSITSRSNLRSSSLREESLPSSSSSSQLSGPRDEKQPSSLAPAVALPSTQPTGLWGKLKGVRRPSSRGGSENLSEKKGKEAVGPDAPKEKKLGSRFVRKASAGKSALAGATARTAQAVGE